MFEIIEVDPETGAEDHLIATGTFREMEQELAELIEAYQDEWDEEITGWSWYRIQPAQ